MPCTVPRYVWMPFSGDKRAIFRDFPIRKSEVNLSRFFIFAPAVTKLNGVDTDIMLRTDIRNNRKEVFYKSLIPCGRCMDCRIHKALEWTVRGVHESELYKRNCFITLTYDDHHLPPSASLSKRELQLFFKRLRFRFPKDSPRYLAAGEYGAKLERPHYHVILFNFDFEDKYLFFHRNSFAYFLSPALRELWPFGHSLVTEVTPETIAYTCRYILKKQFIGKDPEKIQEIYGNKTPEFLLMSRRPGIGYEWWKKYADTDVLKNDIAMYKEEMKTKPPKYYDSLLSRKDPQQYAELKKRRRLDAGAVLDTNDYLNRLDARKKITALKVARAAKRRYETSDSIS